MVYIEHSFSNYLPYLSINNSLKAINLLEIRLNQTEAVEVMMFKAIFLVAFMTLTYSGCQASHDKRIVCYYGNWAGNRPGLGGIHIGDINPRLCTHLVYAYVGLDHDGGIKILNPINDLADHGGRAGYEKFNYLRRWTPGLKTMISLGGRKEESSKYSIIAADSHRRARFVQSVLRFLRRYKFDGLDVDWQYPNQNGGRPCDKENYVLLLEELRRAFEHNGHILSVAVAAAEQSASLSYNIAEILRHVHFINLKTYDFNGSWNKHAGINAPLYASSKATGAEAKLCVDSAVRYWLSQGAPAHMLNLGIPSFGRSFTLEDSAKNEIGASCSGPGLAGPYSQEAGNLGYNEICTDLAQKGWTVVRDKEQRVPYAYKDNQWIGYDDPISVKEKANYINSLGLGGAMLWSLENDDFLGSCGQRYPLLTALNLGLRGGVKKWCD
ncbi:chitinase-3-like protein 1 [Ptiloglossa arizonensis]|uniref:chitinase-3-like protein 1 n=1 Tax=Ptiloglossa arizonensis TaxID=3350558 RepID=UPI003F9F4D3A